MTIRVDSFCLWRRPARLPAFRRIASALDYPTRPVRIIDGFGGGSTPDLVSRLIGQWLSDGCISPSSSTTGSAPAAISRPRRSPMRRRTATRCSLASPRTRSTPRSTSKSGFRFPPRFRAGRRRDPAADGDPGQSIVPGQDASRVHRLCQSQSRQDQFCFARRRHADACRDRAVQDAGRHRRRARAVSRAGAGIHRFAGRPGSGLHHHAVERDRIHQDRQIAGLGGDRRETGGGVAGCADGERSRCPASTPRPGTESARQRARRPAIVDTLSSNIAAGLAEPQIVARIKDLGGETEPMGSAEFAKFLAAETAKWAKVVKFAKMQRGLI